ncbi:hypothetical protein ACSYDW_10825 [Paeniglutamicibacter sp. R2-26]|uniref:hypothetical protein n=1 Tax=Paeniglutamicibacter sp. R2-26 TaxID=3144417 RepID=UPI003EE4E6CD
MDSRHMLRLGVAAAVAGAVLALVGTPVFLGVSDMLPAYPDMVLGFAKALQQALLIGGIFMALGSIMVRHFEVLREVADHSGGGKASTEGSD